MVYPPSTPVRQKSLAAGPAPSRSSQAASRPIAKQPVTFTVNVPKGKPAGSPERQHPHRVAQGGAQEPARTHHQQRRESAHSGAAAPASCARSQMRRSVATSRAPSVRNISVTWPR